MFKKVISAFFISLMMFGVLSFFVMVLGGLIIGDGGNDGPTTTTSGSTGCGTLEGQFDKLGGKNVVSGVPKYCTVFAAFTKFFNVASSVAGIVAVLLIVIGGFQYMTAAGNEKQAESGKNTLIYSVIGLVIIIMAASIVNIVANFLK
jgi:hypothetical protein